MKLSYTLALLASKQAALVSAVAVVWPSGYTPTASEHAMAAARAGEISAQGPPPPGDGDGGPAGLAGLDRRDGAGSATGCVQVHCYADKGTEINLKRYTQLTVWRDGQLILYLVGSKGPGDTGDHIEWVCGRIGYINSIHAVYDWRYLTTAASHSMVQKGGGYCYGESKTGPKCTDASFWEATYTDPAVCGGRANPALCDYRQYCVNVNNVPQCNPNGACF